MLSDAEIDDLLGFTHTGKAPVGKTIPATVSAAELCALTGTSQNAGRELATRGVWRKIGRDRFDARESIRAHCVELARTAKRGTAGSELDREKIRQTRATAEKLEIANALARGELLDATDVERRWAAILRDVRASILAVPSRVGSRLPNLTAHDIGEINREIADALAELADRGEP
jgi:phage terminase Nu1 subunit (DNA packaging protein)